MSAYDEGVCPNGHPRTVANTRRYWNRRGGNYTLACLTCARLRREVAVLRDLVERYRRSHGVWRDHCLCLLCQEAVTFLLTLPAEPQEVS